MLPTHALAGMALALPVAFVAPEYASVAFAAGFVGGVFPDLDLYVGHRKTLHYPVYFAALALPAGAIAALAPTATTVGLALFLLAAALHSVTDVFGGGLELRPWEATSDRAVYDHYNGQWIAPRRWVGYDGSPSDLLLSGVLAAPLVATVDGRLELLVLSGLGVAVAYATVRRVLPSIAEWLFGGVLGSLLPPSLLTRLPARYLPDGAQRTGVDR